MDQRPKQRAHLALLGGAHSLNHSLFFIASPLLGMIMTDFGVPKSEIGFVSMVASFVYGFGALAGGPLGERIGEIKTITMFLLLSGLSTFVMTIAGYFHTLFVYALGLTLIAAWASLYHPTANSLISKTFKGKVAESMGTHGVGGTLGVVLTPTASWFIGSTLGWSWAFVTFGFLCILLALVFLKTFRKTENPRSNRGTIVDALKIRALWILLVFNVTIGLFMKGVELYFPIYLTTNKMVDSSTAAIAYSLVLAAGVPGQWIGGKGSDLHGSKRILIATMAGVSLSLIALVFAPIYAIGVTAFILLYGICFYAHQPALNSLAGFLSPENQRGAVYGIFFFTSFGIGSVSQFIGGYLADQYGFDATFSLLIIFALASLILSFALPDKRETK